MEATKAHGAELTLMVSLEILLQKILLLAAEEGTRKIRIDPLMLNYQNKLKNFCIEYLNNKKEESVSTPFKNYAVKIAKNIFLD